MRIKDVYVGCKVRVKQDLSREDCRFGLNPDMKKFAGKVVTIESIGRTSNGNYSIHIVEDPDYYTWDERCFELKLTAGKGGISRVIFNEPATIVFWDDGEKTVVKCQNDEPYDKEKGLALCYMKKALGNKSNFNNVFKRFIQEENDISEGDRLVVVSDFPDLLMGAMLDIGDKVRFVKKDDDSIVVRDKGGSSWWVKPEAVKKI